jgi:hypothetical protein
MRAALAALLCLLAAPALAKDIAGAAKLFHGADLKNGERLIETYRCNGSCHQSYSADNDPLSLYTRPDRKVNDRFQLRDMVEKCASRLELPIFPEEVLDMAAVLNRDHYKFR